MKSLIYALVAIASSTCSKHNIYESKHDDYLLNIFEVPIEGPLVPFQDPNQNLDVLELFAQLVRLTGMASMVQHSYKDPIITALNKVASYLKRIPTYLSKSIDPKTKPEIETKKIITDVFMHILVFESIIEQLLYDIETENVEADATNKLISNDPSSLLMRMPKEYRDAVLKVWNKFGIITGSLLNRSVVSTRFIMAAKQKFHALIESALRKDSLISVESVRDEL